MTFDPLRRPPIVTDVDRQWALDQEPVDWLERNGGTSKPRGLRFTEDGELIDWDETDDQGDLNGNGGLSWAQHVDEQIEAFERHWAVSGELKSYAEWSRLWRTISWPQADPSIRHPKVKGVPHPFVKRGGAAWDAAYRSCNRRERALADRFGVIQFKPDDPRAVVLAQIAAVATTGTRKRRTASNKKSSGDMA